MVSCLFDGIVDRKSIGRGEADGTRRRSNDRLARLAAHAQALADDAVVAAGCSSSQLLFELPANFQARRKLVLDASCADMVTRSEPRARKRKLITDEYDALGESKI